MKLRLAIMNFLEFAVWGAYLTCMSNYLGSVGLGDMIPWFYSIQGIVSIFMPTIMGMVADRFIEPQRLLEIRHFLAALFIIGCWWIGYRTGLGNQMEERALFVVLYTLSVAFYMPTLALSNMDFFNVSRALFVERETAASVQASARGLFMLMTNGIGASIGTLAASAVVGHYCHWERKYLLGDWQTTWLLLSGYALLVAILFVLFLRVKETSH